MNANSRSILAVFVFCLPAAVLCSGSTAAATEAVGHVSQITLYQGQAMVTREIDFEDNAGALEIVVGDLPEQVVPASLFAEGNEQVEIRAVRFRSRAVGEQPREEVRQLDQQLRELQQQLDLAKRQQHLLGQRSQYLDKLEGFVATTANVELSRGVLDAETLEHISNYSFEQREQIARKEVELKQRVEDIAAEMQLVQRKRDELTRGAKKTVREAVLFLQKHAAGAAAIRLNYLVEGCGWSPSYTIRAAADRQQVRVEYNALIHQLSGENWDDVVLTLSTASPTLSACRPGLAPFHVALGPLAQANAQVALGGQVSRDKMRQQVDNLKGLQTEYAQRAGNVMSFRDNSQLSWELNDVASKFQCLELTADRTMMSVLRGEAMVKGDGPSLSYRLAGTVSLASRSDQQMVRIAQSDLGSRFYHVATPVLTPYVYREAELLNDSDEDLLAGPMTVYLDGRFVGHGEIPTVARGQTFVIGLGADPQFRTRRELAEKQESVQGGNRELRIAYRLVVENFSDAPTQIRVVDRLPHAERTQDIRVTLGEMSDPLSEDKLYLRRERPMGLLRWEIEVPAGASGEDARLIEFKYTVEYDRKFEVTLPASRQLQEEFEQLQRSRQKR